MAGAGEESVTTGKVLLLKGCILLVLSSCVKVMELVLILAVGVGDPVTVSRNVGQLRCREEM